MLNSIPQSVQFSGDHSNISDEPKPFSSQTKPSEPDVFLPYSPDWPTPAQRCILRHSWTTGFLPRHPAACHPALRAGPEGTVRNVHLESAISRKKRYWTKLHVCYYGQSLWAHFISQFISELHFRDLEKQRESSASDIAKKKQEAEAAVSISQAYIWLLRCVSDERCM